MAVQGMSHRTEESKGEDSQGRLREYLLEGFDSIAMWIIEHSEDENHRQVLAELLVMRTATKLIVGRETKNGGANDNGNSSRPTSLSVQVDQHLVGPAIVPLSESGNHKGFLRGEWTGS